MGENTEKYIIFSVPIKKQITNIDKDGNDKIVNISYKIKFIDSFRFMSSSLSSLADNNLATDEILKTPFHMSVKIVIISLII